MIKKVLLFLFFCLLLIGTIKPFFVSGFFPMHDDTQVARVYEMGKALHDGMFPVRWSQDLGYGYGYPLFTFYAPFAYYVGGILTVFGLSALVATKVMMGLGIFLAGVSMYFLARLLWGEKAAFVGGLLYGYATYHAVDIFVRGDVAEFWAYAIVPLIVYAMIKIWQTEKWRYLILGAVCYGALISTHNLSAMMVSPFVLLLGCFLFWKGRKRTRVLLATYFITSLLLSAYYWLPVFSEMRYTNVLSQVGGGADFHDHFVCIQQFWYSPWGFGGSVPGCTDGISFMVGKVALVLSGIGVLLSFPFFSKRRKESYIIFAGFAGLLLSLFLATSYSLPIWNSIKTMAFFQYPWRFLFLASFFSSLLAASVIWALEAFLNKNKRHQIILWLVTGALAMSILFFQMKLFTPQEVLPRSSDFYTNAFQLTWSTSKMSDEYMPPHFSKPQAITLIPHDLVSILAGKTKIILNKTQEKEISVALDSGQVMQVNQAFFPAWEVLIDGQIATYQQTSTGISFLVPSGNHTVRLLYRETFVEQMGRWLSLTGILILFLGIIYAKRATYGKESE